MLKFYFSGAPNPTKVALFLEEAGLPYEPIPVDTRKGQQFSPEFVAVNPNSKVPAIVDGDAVVFDSNAILLYLAEKTGKFLPGKTRYDVLQWLMFQMGGVGPMFGQAHHFMRAKKDEVPYGSERYGNEAKRLYGVMDRQLQKNEFIAGGEYTIADIAIYPWVARHEWHRVELAQFPSVKRWYDALGARPAVQKGMAVPAIS